MKSLSPGSPHAIVMVGIAGSGKTFFAEKFADTFGAPYISADKLAENAKDNESTTSLVRSMLAELMKTKQSIVIDAGGDTRRARSEFAKFLREYGYTPLFVWVQIDQETARQRTGRKKSDVDFDKTLQRFSTPHPSEKPVVISGKHTYASQAKIILKRLSAPRAENSSHQRPPTRQSRSVPIQ